ncbi:hypothetical protein [Mycoavidus sp. SF9855]|uniref:hypothetical protein n=1 Tax=Mycoavidus sp. SF9855 TaxID=2968475 RepID=UPI00211BFB3D|nr:hypothetical protein [Mycoavidus sp. SF9855]UUM21721.1 hypothetical protein NQD60_00925 [Mycoavidus sp. SF9855]
MQIPSSLASIVSYWFPNLGDTEKKAQNGKTPDLCNLSLDQVLQIYKQRDICPAGAEGHDSSPQFIRELEQTSWQQKQLTSGIFNHIDLMTTNMNGVSRRLDRLEPEVQYLAISTFILFLLFIAYARHTNITMQKKFNGDLDKKFEDMKGECSKLIENLTKEIEDQKVKRSTLRDDLTKEIEDSKNMVSSQGRRLDQLDSKIQGTGGKAATLEENLIKLTANLKASQAELEKIANELSTSSQSIKLIQSQAIEAERTRIKGADDLQSQIIELNSTVSEMYRLLERSNLPLDLALSPLGSRTGSSWAGSQSSGSRSGSPEHSTPAGKH